MKKTKKKAKANHCSSRSKTDCTHNTTDPLYQIAYTFIQLIDTSRVSKIIQKYSRTKNYNTSLMDSQVSESMPHLISPSSNVSRVEMSLRLPTIKVHEKSDTLPLTARANSVIQLAKSELKEKDSKMQQLKLKLREKKTVVLAHGDFINLPDFRGTKQIKAEDFINKIKTNPMLINEFIYCFKGSDFYEFYYAPFKEKFDPKRADKNPGEYITISRRGVTHFLKGESTFMSLSDWMNELEKYRKMKRELKFFNQYIIWKNYFLWKKLMKATKIMEKKDELNRNLFLANNILFVQVVHQVRPYALEISNIDLFNNGQWEMIGLAEYEEEVRKLLDRNIHKINKRSEQIILSIFECCMKSTKEFQENNRIDFKDDEKKGMAPFMVGDETHQDMPYTQEAARRTHYRRLAKFIRMQDMIMLDARRMMILNSFRLLSESLGYGLNSAKHEVTKKKRSFLRILLTCKDNKIEYNPTQEQLSQCIFELIDKILENTSTIKQYQSDGRFEGYFIALRDEEEQSNEDNKSLGDIVKEDKSYEISARVISAHIKTVFQKISEYTKSFEEIINELNKNKERNFEELKKSDHSVFQEWLNDFKSIDQKIELIEDTYPKGFAIIDCNILKKYMKNQSQECLKRMKELIPDYITDEMSNLKVKLRDIYEKCSILIEGLALDEYISKYKYFQEHKDKEQDYYDIIEKCRKIDLYAKEYNLNATDKIKLINDTEKQFTSMRTQLNTSLEKCNNKQIYYLRDIDKKYPSIRDVLSEIISELTSERFMDDKYDRIKAQQEKQKVLLATAKKEEKKGEKEKKKEEIKEDVKEETKGEAKDEKTEEQVKEDEKKSAAEIQEQAAEKLKDLVIENIKSIIEFEKRIKQMLNTSTLLRGHEKFLQKEPTEIETFPRAIMLHEMNKKLWCGIWQFEIIQTEWNKTTILSINASGMKEFLSEFTNLIKEINEAREEKEKTDENIALKNLENKVASYKVIIPIVQCMQSNSLGLIDKSEKQEIRAKADKYFNQIKEILNVKPIKEGKKEENEEPVEEKIDYKTITIQYLIDKKNITKETIKKIDEIKSTAEREMRMEDIYEAVKKKWDAIRNISDPRINTDLNLCLQITRKTYDEVNEMMTELNALTGKKQSQFIRQKVTTLYQNMSELLGHLEDIDFFISQNIKFSKLKVLEGMNNTSEKKAEEKESSNKLDTGLAKKAMTQIITAKSFQKQLEFCREERGKSIREKLANINDTIMGYEQCFESYKKTFHRFCLLSTDDLINLFADQDLMHGIILYLPELFMNIKELKLDDDIIEKAISYEGEEISVHPSNIKKISLAGSDYSKIFSNIYEYAKSTIITSIKAIKEKFEKNENIDRCELIKDPTITSQALLFYDCYLFTYEMEFLMQEEDGYDQNFNEWKAEIGGVIGFLLKLINEKSSLYYQKKSAINLILQQLHYSEIIDTIFSNKVHDSGDFLWQQYSRFYYEDSIPVLHIGDISIEYGYEFMGSFQHIQVIPQTERCFLSLSQAMKSRQGIIMAGNSGEGKLETIKELARTCAKFFVEFTCSQTTPIYELQNIIFAPVFIGFNIAWLALRHIDLLPFIPLSVLGQDLNSIRIAQLTNKPIMIGNKAEEEQTKDTHSKNTSIPIYFASLKNSSISPAINIPQNLKQYFRPVYVTTPDFSELFKIPLYSHGVNNFDQIGDKMTLLFKIAPTMMSPQPSYEFTYRKVHSFNKEVDRLLTLKSEPILTILEKSIANVILPSLLKPDVGIFISVFNNVFGTRDTFKNLSKSVIFPEFQKFCESTGNTLDEFYLEKSSEIYQSLQTMKGVFVIGKYVSGKTTIINNIIQFANSNNKAPKESPAINAITIYPSAYSPGMLLGKSVPNIQWDKDTVKPLAEKDGKDEKGILKDYLSKACESKEFPTWLILNGDLQYDESDMLSQLLDSHPKICLGNGVVMTPKSELKIIFENSDVSCYSPNILYKAGIVHIFPDKMSWQRYTDEWISMMECKYKSNGLGGDSYFNSKIKDILSSLMTKTVPIALEKRESMLKYYSIEPVIYLCKIIESIYSPVFYVFDDKPIENRIKILERIYSYSFMWSMTTGMNKNESKRFEKETQSYFNAGNLPKGSGGILSIFDHFPDIKHNDKFGDFKACGAKRMVHFAHQNTHTVFVHTKESFMIHMISKVCLYGDIDIWFEGSENIGKTSAILQSLAKLKESRNPNQVMLDYLYYSVQSCTTPESLQASLDKRLDRKKKNLFDGLNGKKAVIFIDDLHVGSDRMAEYARMLISEKGFYNREPTYWKQIMNASYIICTNTNSSMSFKKLRVFKARAEPLSDDGDEDIFKPIFEEIYTKGKYIEEMKESLLKIGFQIRSVYKNIKEDIKVGPRDVLKRFGIKEVMRVLGEFMLASTESLTSKSDIEYLWANQTLREYGDRLTKESEIRILKEIINSRITVPKKESLLFTDLLGVYKMVDNFEDTKQIFLNKMKNFLVNEALDIYICQEFIINVLKIHRAVYGNYRNVLLVGPDSVKRKTMLKMVAFLKGYKLEIFTGKEPMVNVLMSIIKSKQTTIVYINIPKHLSDHNGHILSLLNNKSDPSLVLNDEEISSIMDRKYDKGEKYVDADQHIEHFITNISNACHFAFSGNDSENAFIQCVQKAPFLMKSSTIIAVTKFPEAVLKESAREMIDAAKSGIPDAILDAFLDANREMCKIDKRMYTFKVFLDGIKLYISLYNDKKAYIDTKISKITEAISVWTECGKVFMKLKEKLDTLKGPVIAKGLNEEEEKNVKEQFIKNKKEMEENKILNEKFYRIFSQEDEKRWTNLIEDLQKEKVLLSGNTFIMAILLNYFGVFTASNRILHFNAIKKVLSTNSIKYTENLNPYEYLTNKLQAQKWIGDVFPNDEYDLLNAIIMINGPRIPLICDKYRILTRRLIEKLTSEMNIKAKDSSFIEKPNVFLISQYDNSFISSLKHSMLCGGVVIVDEVNYFLDPRLRPLLLNQAYTKPADATKRYIKLEKEECELSKNFVLVILSNLEASELPTEMIVNCSVINVDYSTNIMTEVILNEICKKNIDDSAYYRNMIEQENKIIEHIYKYKSKIILPENSKALDYLEITKSDYYKAFNNYNNEPNPSNKDLRREQYRAIAILFQYMCKISIYLQQISPLYATTLTNYIKGLITILNEEDPSPDPPTDGTRESVLSALNVYFYREMWPKIMHKHKVLFKFLLSSYNLIAQRQVREAELIIVIKGLPGTVNAIQTPENAIKQLSELMQMLGEPYTSIVVAIQANIKVFNDWVNCLNLNSLMPPKEILKSLDKKKYSEEFTNLVLIKICKGSAIKWAINRFVGIVCFPTIAEQMEIENAKIEMKFEIKALDCRTPWIIVTSKNYDPIQQVLEWLPLNKEKENTEIPKKVWRMTNFTHGYLKQLSTVLLSSTHLIIKSMHLINNSYEALRSIYGILNYKCKDTIDKDFRLILITEDSLEIPRQFSCSAKKFILRQHKTKIEKQLELLNSVPEPTIDDPRYKKLLFSLTLMHSALCMRGKYNFLLWSTHFKYTPLDFTAAYEFLKDYYNLDKPNLEAIINPFISATYGRIMKSENDKKVLYHITQNYINEKILTETKYIFSDSSKYYIPDPLTYNEFATRLKEFPPLEYSDLFNEGKAEAFYYQTHSTNKLLSKLMQCFETEPSKKEEFSVTVGKLIDAMPSKVYDVDISEQFKADFTPIKPTISPLSACLYQEIQKANTIVTAIKADLEFIKNCTNDFRADLIQKSTINAIESNIVPPQWAKLHHDYPTLAGFLDGITEKVEYIRKWAKDPKIYYWLGGLFYPQSLLSAIKLTFMYKKISLEYDTEITKFNEPKEINSPIENSYYLFGLYMKNAKIQEGTQSLDDTNLPSDINRIPLICIMPVQSVEAVEGTYNCPVFMTQYRDMISEEKNLIMSIRIPTEVISEYWTLKGVSILCNKQ